MPNRIEDRSSQPEEDLAQNVVTNEVLDNVIDHMPEPSTAAEEIISESAPTGDGDGIPSDKGGQTGNVKAGVSSRVEWISESTPTQADENVVESGTQLVDKDGVAFDPAIHCTKPDGSPTMTKGGRFRRRKGAPVAGPQPNVQMALSASLATVYAIEMLGSAIGGDEWKPEQPEHDMMISAWQDYYIQTGAGAPPAWLGVAIATGAYALPRLQKPVTVSRLSRIKQWFVGLFNWSIGRRVNAQSNNRHDRIG